MGDGRNAVLDALLVGMDEKIDPEPAGLAVAKGDHLAELPRRVDMEQRERRLARIEGFQRQMQHHRGILADRVEHHRVAELGRDLAHDMDALRLELAKIGGETLLHGLVLRRTTWSSEHACGSSAALALGLCPFSAFAALRSSAR